MLLASLAKYTYSGTWNSVKFKPYNFKAMGTPAMSGALHPRTDLSRILALLQLTVLSSSEQSTARVPANVLRNGIRGNA